ncbi:hypothetical protein KVMX100_100003 [Klebsiella variicola]|nr:hypothetical protein KVMX100_100003 [Klebsiella variicola]
MNKPTFNMKYFTKYYSGSTGSKYMY